MSKPNAKSDGKQAANVNKGSGSKPGLHDSGSVQRGGDAGAEATEKSHDVKFAEGGDTPMYGKQEANPATPRQTGKNDVRGPGAEFAKGGSNKMFGYAASQPAQSGITSAR